MIEKTERLSRAHTHLDTSHSHSLRPRVPIVCEVSAFRPSPVTAHIIPSIGLRALQLSGPHTNSYCCCTGGGGRTPRSCETTPARQRRRNRRSFVWKRLRGPIVPPWNRRGAARATRIPRPRVGSGGGEVRGCWGREGPSLTSAPKAVEGGGGEPAGFRGRRRRAGDAAAARESREGSPKRRSPAGGRGLPGGGRSRVRGRAAPRRSGGGAAGVGDPARSGIFQREGSGERS